MLHVAANLHAGSEASGIISFKLHPPDAHLPLSLSPPTMINVQSTPRQRRALVARGRPFRAPTSLAQLAPSERPSSECAPASGLRVLFNTTRARARAFDLDSFKINLIPGAGLRAGGGERGAGP